MLGKGNLTISAKGDLEIVWTRAFNAPPEFVFEALTTPALVQRWLLGPDGWTMPVCEIDLRVGGSYRYVWSHAQQGTMGVGGVYREIKIPCRIVQTEKFDQAWYPGEALQTLELKKEGGMTWMTASALFETKEARDAALNSNMEKGMVPSYDRLDEIAEQNAKAAL